MNYYDLSVKFRFRSFLKSFVCFNIVYLVFVMFVGVLIIFVYIIVNVILDSFFFNNYNY